jgi:hypothetical protein
MEIPWILQAVYIPPSVFVKTKKNLQRRGGGGARVLGCEAGHGSERDVVIHVVETARRLGRRGGRPWRGCRSRGLAGGRGRAHALAAAQHLHLVGADFGAVLFDAGWSVHLRVRRLPSTYTCEPLRRYWPTISARRPLKTTRCHSVASRISPVCLSFHLSVVAIVTLATWSPLGNVRISGSRPRLPTMMTLLTDAMVVSLPCKGKSAGWKKFRGAKKPHCAATGLAAVGAAPDAVCNGFQCPRQPAPHGRSQVSTSHRAQSAVVANKPTGARPFDQRAAQRTPPANRPSDCSVL